VSGRRPGVRAVLAALALVALAAATAAACPNCAEAVASQPDGSGDGPMTGYFWSIVSMVSMPFLLTGAVAGYFVLSSRRVARAARTP
jgi:hypothetical protein